MNLKSNPEVERIAQAKEQASLNMRRSRFNFGDTPPFKLKLDDIKKASKI